MTYRLLVLALVLGSVLQVKAQKGVIAGIAVSGESKAVLNGATVKLFKKGDSLFKKVDQTDDKGFFSFLTLPKGVYNLTIT